MWWRRVQSSRVVLSCWLIIYWNQWQETDAVRQSRKAIHPRDFQKQHRQRAKRSGNLDKLLENSGVHRWKGFRYPSQNLPETRGLQRGMIPEKVGRSSLREGKGQQSYSKQSEKGRGGSYPSPPLPPKGRPRPVPSATNNEEEIADGNDERTCFVEMTAIFLQFPALTSPADADPAFVIDNAPKEQQFGTSFVYNDALLEETKTDIVELEDSFATGVCTRTQMRQAAMQDGTFVSGGGYCHFTYTLIKDGGRSQYTFNAAGEVFDSFGGLLPIVGGTGTMLGVTGQVQLIPYDIAEDGEIVPSDADFFTGAEIYRADATLYMNICLQQPA